MVSEVSLCVCLGLNYAQTGSRLRQEVSMVTWFGRLLPSCETIVYR